MGFSIDKNNVDISKLFNWGTELDLYDSGNNFLMTVYIRLVGDDDLSKAKVYGLRKSAELRKRLKQPDSDERLAFIPEKEFIEKDLMVEQLLIYKMREYSSKVYNEMKFNLPVEPSSAATLEEQEKYQNEIDVFPTTRENEIKEKILSFV